MIRIVRPLRKTIDFFARHEAAFLVIPAILLILNLALGEPWFRFGKTPRPARNPVSENTHGGTASGAGDFPTVGFPEILAIVNGARARPGNLPTPPQGRDNLPAPPPAANSPKTSPATRHADNDSTAPSPETRADALLVDARPGLFYDDGHIPGAVNLPPADFQQEFPKLRARLKAASRIIVYCGDPHCGSAHHLAARLRANGLQNIFLYPGGHIEWQRGQK